jgi:SNF2 family DNA or RNA helicase
MYTNVYLTNHYQGSRELSSIYWEMLVIDEAHKIKNHSSKLSTTLREEYRFRNSLLLTGTPLQNNTDELWSLLHFVDDSHFASLSSFKARFGELKEPKQLQALQV